MITPLATNAKIVTEDRGPTAAFKLFMLQITELSIIAGQGSPEGALIAGKGKLYMDEDGASGTVLYIKQKEDIGGDRSLGWILV